MWDATGKQITLHDWVAWASRQGSTCFQNEGYVEGWTEDGKPKVRTRLGKRLTIHDSYHCKSRTIVVGRYCPDEYPEHPWRRLNVIT
jgi:hypothetical protein